MKINLILLITITSCVMFSSCSHYATVAEKRPKFRPVSGAVGGMISVQRGIASGLKRSKSDPLASIGDYLTAAEAASRQLSLTPNDKVVRDDYNFALSRVFSAIQDGKLDPWTRPLTVPAVGGDFVLTNKPFTNKKWNPALYDFKPADQFEISGDVINERETKEGIGAPLVAIGRAANADAKENFYLPRTYYGVTAVARFSGRRCEIAFEDPLATESVLMEGRSFPLAGDFTVPVATMLASTKPEKMGLARLLNPGKYAYTARVSRLQPFDPNKTVVLVVHGLNSSPATWTPMINTLRGNEMIRRNYQFWFYSYPSGYPYPHSAAILRRELEAIEKKFPLKKKMVVLGHSMGGCISRLLITDTDDKIWMGAFGKPPEQVAMSPESKKLFTDAVIFKHRPEIGRVVFLSAPLRGADMAENWIGRLGAKLVKSPAALLRAGSDMLKVATFKGGDLKLKRIPNSVDTLAPNNHFVKAINQIPITPGIPYHVICGDRGKGGNKDKTKPVMSDGLVPYWSSHLPAARSELIVPSGHSSHFHPKAIEEVRRILLLHAGKNQR